MPASDTEHVVPQAILRAMQDVGIEEILRGRIETVRACRECNHLLGATYQKTLEERKKYLKQRLQERYRAVLAMPDWSVAALDELGPMLRKYVDHGLLLRELIKSRLRW